MRFKPPRFNFQKFAPRVVRADEPADAQLRANDAAADADQCEIEVAEDLELPDELAALAEQLGADAEYLAARYPADAKDRGVRTAAVRNAPSRTVGLAERGRDGFDRSRRLEWGAQLFERRQAPPIFTAEAPAPHVTQPTLTADVESEYLPVEPAMFFQDLSGPEQEGLLDLLEEESLPQSSLSI